MSGSSLPSDTARTPAIPAGATAVTALLDASPEPAFLIAPDGTILAANQALAMRADATPGGIVGADIFSLLPGQVAESRRKQVRRAVDTRARLEFADERDGRLLEHHLVPIAGDDGEVICVAGFVQDVTARTRMEEDLRESEAHYHLLHDTMLQGVVYQDADGVVISMNPAAERILGKTREEFLGSTSVEQEYHTLRDDGAPFPGLEHPAMVALRTGEQVSGVRMGVYNPREGQYRWIRISAVPLFRDGDPAPCQVYTLFEDVTERREAEAMIRRQREELSLRNQQLQGLFDFSPAGLVLYEAEPPYRVLAHNAYYQQLWPEPFASAGLVGKGLHEYAPLTVESGIRAVFDEVVRTGQGQTLLAFPYDGIAGRGRTWWNWTCTPVLRDGRVVALAHLVIDVTDEVLARGQAEESLAQLARQRDLQRQVFDMLPVGAWLIDDTGRLSAGNPAGQRIWAGARWVGVQDFGVFRAWRAETGEEVTAGDWAGGRAFTRGETTLEEELVIQCFDGTRKTILDAAVPLRDAEGRITGAVVTNQDITARKATEEALRRSEERFRLATAAANGVIYDYDLAARTVEVSEGFDQLFGEPPPETPLTACWWQDRIHPDDAEALSRRINAFFAGGAARFELEYRLRHASGHWRDVWDRGFILRDADGAPVRVIGSVTDITPLKEIDHAKDEFLAVLSHELQTPLTSMLGFAAHALEIDSLDVYRRTVPIIQRNARRQARLVNELLDMSKLLQGRVESVPEPARLDGLATTVLEWLLPVAETAGVALRMAPQAESLPVRVDPRRLLTCIEHLVGNAVKFTPAGGAVTLACRREGDRAVLAVTDTGRGIDPAHLPLLFKPFRQVDRDEAAGGLGLGLAVVRGYVEWHGGTVAAASPGPGLGSTFTLALPLAPDDDPRPADADDSGFTGG